MDEDFPGGGYMFDTDGQLVGETKDWLESMLVVEFKV